jgi:hypothetical protein
MKVVKAVILLLLFNFFFIGVIAEGCSNDEECDDILDDYSFYLITK